MSDRISPNTADRRVAVLVACVLASAGLAGLVGRAARADEEPNLGEGETGAFAPLDHSLWDAVLRAHVTVDGRVDYAGLSDSPGDLQRLDEYLAYIADITLWDLPEAELLAFWINAYNACAVRTALDLFPLESVRSAPDFFDARRLRVAGRSLSLNGIENDIIARDFREPRTHFAITTLSRSSPGLRDEAYTGARLSLQLSEQTRVFVNATIEFRPNAMEVGLSRLFEWFARDFDQLGGVRGFVSGYLDAEASLMVRNPNLVFVYADFDWRLNAPEEAPGSVPQ